MSELALLKIPQISDKAILAAFRQLARDFGIASSHATTLAGGTLVTLPLTDADAADGSWETLIRLNSTLIKTFHYSFNGLGIYYYRNGKDGESSIFDVISVHFNTSTGTMSENQRLEIIAFLSKKLKAFDPNRSALASGAESSNHLNALHESALSRLEQLAADIITGTAEKRAALEVEFAAKNHELDIQLQQFKSTLQMSHDLDVATLRTKEEALSTREAAIDDRDNTHARREIRNRMLDDVKARIENFGVSQQTELKRRPVAHGVIFLNMALFVFICFTAFEIQIYNSTARSGQTIDFSAVLPNALAQKNDTELAHLRTVSPRGASILSDSTGLYFLWARISILTLGLIGTLLYYIRWQNRWADQHAISEFHLQQFYIDVNRANWVIESGLEWRKETENEIPETILASVTKNLFNSQNELPTVLHPADELASALLGSASKLKIKSGGSELEFDKPSKIPN